MQEMRESEGCCLSRPDGIPSRNLPKPDDYLGGAGAGRVSAGEPASVIRTVSDSGSLSLTAALPAQISRSPESFPQPLGLADSEGDSPCAKLGPGAVVRMGT